jgi:hypothetical protein
MSFKQQTLLPGTSRKISCMQSMCLLKQPYTADILSCIACKQVEYDAEEGRSLMII